MRKFYFLALMAMLFLGLGLLLSCGDDDDDDDSGSDDDDVSGDTWTDSSSGLTWQVTPSSGYMMWEDAIEYCENLTLAGGGWHLPTISELRTLIRGCDATVTGGSCGVTDSCLDYDCKDDSCGSCIDGEGPNFDGCYGPSELPGECFCYLSSSPVADDGDYAWLVHFNYGSVYSAGHYTYARCVR